MEQSWIDFLLNYGYIGIYVFLVLGIVGLPLPDEIMMTFVGYLSSEGQLIVYYTYLSAVSGSISGISISYFLGNKLGYPFVKKHGSKFMLTRRRFRVTQLLFRKYGNWVLFFGYFIPGVRHLTAYVAGISNMPFRRFGLYAYSGAVTWCLTFIGLGFILGEQWERVFALFEHYGSWLLILSFIFAPLAIYLWFRTQNTSQLRRIFRK
ncbi:DedA family protein [Mechercharimyces sp. CAU 1602]|uniref:DedA family protein n=1 Tax=Mechercharimyces sp. CAU 1602 TaxID=2973933 RepID=UPI002161A776|nr:DedA family protein [Mechercharimyces sp. CAU 1602]MCS1350502.1 DedA family protein [Mechercharimyces sp. CAU 1602]